MPPDFYTLLGVARTASTDEITAAFHVMARELHPDTNPGTTKLGTRFQAAVKAYAALHDPVKRAMYDATLEPLQRATSMPPHPSWTTPRDPAPPPRPEPATAAPPFHIHRPHTWTMGGASGPPVGPDPAAATPAYRYPQPQSTPDTGRTFLDPTTTVGPEPPHTLSRTIYMASRVPATALGLGLCAEGLMNDLGQALALGVAIILLALPAWWMIMGMEALVPGMRRQAVVRSLLVTMRVPYFALGILGFGAGLVTGFWPLALLGVAFVLHPVVVWRRNTGSDVQSWRSSYAPPPPIQRAAQPTPPDAGRTRLDPRVAARYFRRSAAAHAVDLILAALLWLAIATISEGSVQAGSVFTLAWWCAANAGSAVALFLGYPRLCRLVGSRTLGRRLLRL